MGGVNRNEFSDDHEHFDDALEFFSRFCYGCYRVLATLCLPSLMMYLYTSGGPIPLFQTRLFREIAEFSSLYESEMRVWEGVRGPLTLNDETSSSLCSSIRYSSSRLSS